jgi:hypothetical protein
MRVARYSHVYGLVDGLGVAFGGLLPVSPATGRPWPDGALVTGLVPEQPRQCEPPAVKCRHNSYPQLDLPRQSFQDHLEHNGRCRIARHRGRGLTSFPGSFLLRRPAPVFGR